MIQLLMDGPGGMTGIINQPNQRWVVSRSRGRGGGNEIDHPKLVVVLVVMMMMALQGVIVFLMLFVCV